VGLHAHVGLELAYLALPVVGATGQDLLFHDEDVLLVFELFLHVDDPNKVFHHADLLLGRRLHPHLLHAVESVAHHSDEEVHEQ